MTYFTIFVFQGNGFKDKDACYFKELLEVSDSHIFSPYFF